MIKFVFLSCQQVFAKCCLYSQSWWSLTEFLTSASLGEAVIVLKIDILVRCACGCQLWACSLVQAQHYSGSSMDCCSGTWTVLKQVVHVLLMCVLWGELECCTSRLGSAACCAIPELVGLEGTSAHHPVPPSSQHVQVALECLQRGRLPDALGCLFHWSVERRSSSCWGGTSSRFTSPAQLFPTCFQSKRQECWWKTPGP